MKIISGVEISNKIEQVLKQEVDSLRRQGINICLGTIVVGSAPASMVYIGQKHAMCAKLDIKLVTIELPKQSDPIQIYHEVEKLNRDGTVNGVICHMPLPPQVSEKKIVDALDPEKDVDCFHPYNLGLLVKGTPRFIPCTAYSVVELLKQNGINTAGKHTVIVGRSAVVGRPLSILLSLKDLNSTVTVCHTGTENLEKFCSSADILVSAVGRPKFIKARHVKPGAVIVDVGISQELTDEGKYRIIGDVDLDAISSLASQATPVPGGVGPLTIMMLMLNTINAARMQSGMKPVDLSQLLANEAGK